MSSSDNSSGLPTEFPTVEFLGDTTISESLDPVNLSIGTAVSDRGVNDGTVSEGSFSVDVVSQRPELNIADLEIGLSEIQGGSGDTETIQDSSSNSSHESSNSPEALVLIWDYCRAMLRKSIDSHRFDGYIAPLSLNSINPLRGIAQLLAPSPFVRATIETEYSERIAAVIQQAISQLKPVLEAHGLIWSATSAIKVVVGIAPTLQSNLPHSNSNPNNRERPVIGNSSVLSLGANGSGIGTTSSERSNVVVKKILPSLNVPNNSASSGVQFNGSSQVGLTRPLVSSSSATGSVPSVPGINPRYTFSNFVVGSSNEFGHAAAMRVAEQPGRSYNPLFIYGGVGLGKTHLLHAIANAVIAKNPRAHILYMSSESFTNDLISALRTEKMNDFKKRLRSVELLLIDDIQFLCGKERTQEEFFHTFNALYDAKHQIVVTSDRIPQEMPGMEERLQTRFSWGLTADLQAPDFETRVAILNRKATAESINLPADVAHLIAEKISSNVRELEGALTRLHALSSLQGSAITVPFTMSALRPMLLPKTVNISVDDIKKSICDFFNIRVSEMVSKKRTRNLSYPRHIAMYLCRKHTTLSYPEIGENFGGRDHSSVIHASNVVATKVAHDPDTKQLVIELERRLLGSNFVTH